MAPKLAILRKCIHTSCPCYFLITWWFHRDIGMFSLFFSLCCDRRNSRNQLYIYAECEELGSTILSKIPTSEKCRIAKIAIWYYRGGSCSRACLKKSFRELRVPVCGRFYPNEGGVAGYGNRMRVKYTAKWGLQIAEMIFQTRSSVYWDLGINRKMGLGNPQQDENLMREYCDERQYC